MKLPATGETEERTRWGLEREDVGTPGCQHLALYGEEASSYGADLASFV